MMGRSFQADDSTSEVGGADVGVVVRVGTGVMGENCLGFCVAVGCEMDTTARAGNVCVGRARGVLDWLSKSGVLSRTGTWVGSAAQEVTKIQTIKAGTNKRFIN